MTRTVGLPAGMENEGGQSGFCHTLVGEVTLGSDDSFSAKIR
jgi:hypothetical protein